MVADFADSMVESAIRCSRCYIPLHAGTQELLNDYLDEARHAADTEGALFRPISNNAQASSTTPSPPTAFINSCAATRWP
jgi:hypothetical protein